MKSIVNADVRTVDQRGTVAEAIAWEGGKIRLVGTTAEVTKAAGTEDVIDAKGATVVPGFIDAHHHPFVIALYGGQVRLEAPAVTDIPSLQRALADAAKETPSERWLVAAEWNEEKLAERRAPTRQELDDAVPDRPVFALHYSCHRGVANSRALELARIGPTTPEPSGGRIERGAGALPTGLLVERGMSKVEALARASLVAHDAEAFLARLGEHHGALLEAGITRVADSALPVDLEPLYREAVRRGVLRVPTMIMRTSAAGWLEPPDDILDLPMESDGDLLTFGPLKLVFDGAPVCSMCLGWLQVAGAMLSTWGMVFRRTSLDPLRAAMSLAPRYGAKVTSGVAIYAGEEAKRVVRSIADAGHRVATHAIGNAAVDEVVLAYEAAGGALAKHGPARIEHAIFLERELVRRIADLDVMVVAQPAFTSVKTFDDAAAIPGLPGMPLRWLLDAKIRVAGSSDHPVASFAPLDGIRAAVSRRTPSGRVYEPDQRVTLDEALVMFTRIAAEACGCLDRSGTLEAGKRADIVVLDGPLTDTTLETTQVRQTILAGETVFSRM